MYLCIYSFIHAFIFEIKHVRLLVLPIFNNKIFDSVTEELKEAHWLPLDVGKTYTLMEFKNALISRSQESLQMLEKLSQCRALILNMVVRNFDHLI